MLFCNLCAWLVGLLDYRPFRILSAVLGYIATVILVIVALYLTGPTTTNLYAEDTLELLDIANRMCEGHRPYTDFHMGYGPISFLFIAWGISLTGLSIKAYWIGQMMAIFAVGSLCFFICSRKLRPFWTMLVTLNATMILFMPTPLGYKVWRQFGYAMWYNKLAFVLSGIIILSTLVPLRRSTKINTTIFGILDGICLAVLFMTKISFFVPILILYITAKLVWPCRGEDFRSQGILAIGSMVFASWAILAGCHTNFEAYIEATRIYGMHWDVPFVLLMFRYLQFTNMLFFILVVLTLIFGIGFIGGGSKSALIRSILMCTLAVGCLLVGTATSEQHYDVIPFLGLVPLVACLCIRRQGPIYSQNAFGMSVAVLAAVLLLLTFPKDSALSAAFKLKSPLTLNKAMILYNKQLKVLNDLEKIDANEKFNECFKYIDDDHYNEHVQAALALLQQCGCKDKDILYVCSNTDIVTMFTNCGYPKGPKGVYAQQPRITPTTDENATMLFSDDFLSTTTLILRHEAELPLWRRLERVKGKELSDNFNEIGKNTHWTLYRRQQKTLTNTD